MLTYDSIAGHGVPAALFIVAAAFDSDAQTTAAERELEARHVQRDDISIVSKTIAPAELEKPNPSKTVAYGAVAGTLIGGLTAALFLVPGVGPILAAGPLALMVAGLGGVVGSFVGLGLTREEAQRYQEMLDAGAEIVTIRVEGEEQASEIASVLAEHGAHDIIQHAVAS